MPSLIFKTYETSDINRGFLCLYLYFVNFVNLVRYGYRLTHPTPSTVSQSFNVFMAVLIS
jgi:hypothetical protein